MAMLVSCKLINVTECYLKVALAGFALSFIVFFHEHIPRKFIVGFGYHREVETMNQLAMQRKSIVTKL
jgi:hypothetical protein